MTLGLPRTNDGKFMPGFSYSPETMFRPGQEPPNKGKKFPGSGNSASFRKGNEPHNTLHDYATTVRSNNKGQTYKYIRLEKGKWEFMQKWRWANEVGPIPAGMILRCKTKDRLNCEPSNWELITRAENARRNKLECDVKPAVCIVCNTNFESRNKKARYCSDECRRLGNLKLMQQWHAENPHPKKEGPKNLMNVVKECIVCGSAFFQASNIQKTCSQTCRTVHRHRTFQNYRESHPREKSERKVLPEKRCSKCGQNFTPYRFNNSICSLCRITGPRTVNCLQCGTEFISTGRGIELLCSDECRRQRKTLMRAKYGYKEEEKKPGFTCACCHQEFENIRKVKYCSAACRAEIHRQKAAARYQAKPQKQVKEKAEKTSLSKLMPERVAVEDRSASKGKAKRNPKLEREAALNMIELNRNAPLHDRDIIREKQIVSPDLSTMPFRIYDKRLKQTFFFRTEEKYLNYLNKLQNEKTKL